MHHQGRLGQHRQKRMMALAPRPAWVIPLGGSLLMARTLEDRRVQVQGKALRRPTHLPQQPPPQRPPETLDGTLAKAVKQPAHGVGPRPPRQAHQRVQSPVGSRPLGVRKPARSGDHANHKRQQSVGQRDRVGTAQLPRHVALHLLGKAALLQKGYEAGQTAKGGNRTGSLRQFDFGFSKKRSDNRMHRSVPIRSQWFLNQTYSASGPWNRTTFF